MIWTYVLHDLNHKLANVYLIELVNNRTHIARKIGVNSYSVEVNEGVQFYSWRVGNAEEWIDTLGPGCDWMPPSRIARITETGVYNVSNYFNICTAHKTYKVKMPMWGLGDRFQALVSTLTLMHISYGKRLILYWTPPANMRSTRHLHDQDIFKYFYVDDPRVQITQDSSLYKNIRAIELISYNGFQNIFSKEIGIRTHKSDKYVRGVYCKIAYQLVKPTRIMFQSVNLLPKFELAVHIRRTNKVRDIGNTDFEVKPNELNILNKKTRQTLRIYSNKSNRVFVCGDSEYDTRKYRNILSQKVVESPPIEDTVKKMFFDFFAMGKAKRIITSQRYSSFSMTSALIHGRLITVVLARPRLRSERPCIFGFCADRFLASGLITDT